MPKSVETAEHEYNSNFTLADVRFAHRYCEFVEQSNHQGVLWESYEYEKAYLTLCVRTVVHVSGAKTFFVSFAFCAPNDQFSYKVGRNIAFGRLRSNTCVTTYRVERGHKFVLDEALGHIFAAWNHHAVLPEWFKDALKDLPAAFKTPGRIAARIRRRQASAKQGSQQG